MWKVLTGSMLVGAMALSGCGAPEPDPTNQPLFYFEGSVDVAKNAMELHLVSPPGAIREAVTLPYGMGAGKVYFHTCTASYNAVTNLETGSVQVVSQVPGITTINAIIDSISDPNVTAATGIPPVIQSYTSFSATANCTLGPTRKTWSFDDPFDANFTFKGHADGT